MLLSCAGAAAYLIARTRSLVSQITVEEMRRKVGVSKSELLGILRSVRFTNEEQQQMTAAIKQSHEVFGHAGSH